MLVNQASPYEKHRRDVNALVIGAVEVFRCVIVVRPEYCRFAMI